MNTILANKTISITELKKNPSCAINQAEQETVAVLRHNTPAAYLLSPKLYEKLINILEDYELGMAIKERQNEELQAKEISLNDL